MLQEEQKYNPRLYDWLDRDANIRLVVDHKPD